jgi:hypothetical protein
MFEKEKSNDPSKTSFQVPRSRPTKYAIAFPMQDLYTKTEGTILRIVCSKERNWYLRKQSDAIRVVRPSFKPKKKKRSVTIT